MPLAELNHKSALQRYTVLPVHGHRYSVNHALHDLMSFMNVGLFHVHAVALPTVSLLDFNHV